MKCPKCQFENREDASFCLECGEKLELECPQCGKTLPRLAKFCDKCGQRLEEVVEVEKAVPEAKGERKHITVLFSDLSGYTAIAERLDPEEVKEIMSRVFSEIAQAVTKYEGFIEKFVGDAVMAFFGVPKAHEDDPVRAIRAAREIHELVAAMSPELEEKVGQPLSMHTGINTGLVVTGEVNLEKGTHGIAGDTINLASRLGGLAKAGEILVGPDTYRQAEGYFDFEELELTKIKGRAEPVQVYKLLSAKERPVTVHRLSGLRATLIGRTVELTELREAVENLKEGKGRIFSICGDAGTGKSRLVEEFKSTLDLDEIQWLEGHAYAYAQNIPYFPMMDLFNRAFQIEESDPPAKVRERIETEIEGLVGKNEDVIPYVGSLFGLDYPEVKNVSPEFWKSRLREAIKAILTALAQRAPTVFFLEDLHWADPSFGELLRHTLTEIRQPAIVLCVYRPTFNLFTSHQLSGIGKIYQEIRLQDLSPSEAQNMLESLLKTDSIPSDLRRFVQDQAEGNPFYLEEFVNSLIESNTLIRDNGSWRVTRAISESGISSTIHGVISGRLDRLEKETKRVLQEASVIGRSFLYEILRRITELKKHIEISITSLERLDLIRTRSLRPDLEYIFKHALTQEVAYNGLLKKERQIIHERIAFVMEELFEDRLPEFYETLAFHYTQGQSVLKAVDYLTKSGEKSYKRYALEESDKYYKKACEILSNKRDRSREEDERLIDVLNKWAMVHAVRAEFKELASLLSAHEYIAESLDDKERLGTFYGWLGYSLAQIMKLKDSYEYLLKALKLGEEIDNDEVIAYACAWLSFTCAELGRLDEAVMFGKRGREISSRFTKSDPDLFLVAVAYSAMAHFFTGDSKEVKNLGNTLLELGTKRSDARFITNGHIFLGMSHQVAGDFSSAIEYYNRAIQIAKDPLTSYIPRVLLGLSYVSVYQVEEAEKILNELMILCEGVDDWIFKTTAQMLLGLVLISKGELSKGTRTVENLLRVSLESESRYRCAAVEFLLGRFYLQMVLRAGPKTFSFFIKNIGFLIRRMPVASKKAEAHFNRAIELASEIGAKGLLGQAYLDLGLLHKARGRTDQARECISEAIRLFEQCEAEVYLKQAKETLASLG